MVDGVPHPTDTATETHELQLRTDCNFDIRNTSALSTSALYEGPMVLEEDDEGYEYVK